MMFPFLSVWYLQLGVELVLPHFSLVLDLLHLFAADAAARKALYFYHAYLQFKIQVLLLLLILCSGLLYLHNNSVAVLVWAQ